MIRVEEAERIIQSQLRDYGTETISFELSLGRVLVEDIRADRDLPAFDRATMDGIAVLSKSFERGIRTYKIKATQAAGDAPVEAEVENECIEIMTGAAVPTTADTVIRYEDLKIKDGEASIQVDSVRPGQNIHKRGVDKKKNELIVAANQLIGPAILSQAASVGKTQLLVRKLPKVAIISTGDELVDVNTTPLPYQLRRSNNYTIRAILKEYGIHANMFHIPDQPEIMREMIGTRMENHDVLILSGGVSMGKFDYVPEALEACGVNKLFHKVQQKPGKPFWFGTTDTGKLVFAFPGNPVSTFMCVHRYFLPWLRSSLQMGEEAKRFACLGSDFSFNAALQYFLQVRLEMNEQAQLIAHPAEGHGSGDFVNLSLSDAFMELPLEQNNFTKGQVFRIWPWKFFS